MAEPTSWVDQGFRILMGHAPHDISLRGRRIDVMANWDVQRFDDDRKKTIAKMALCQIAYNLHDSPDERYPYSWEEVIERLRELMPELGGGPIGIGTIQKLLCGKHESQYSQPRHV